MVIFFIHNQKKKMVPSLITSKAFTVLLYRRSYSAVTSKVGAAWVTRSDKGGYTAQNSHGCKLEKNGPTNLEEPSGSQSAWAPDPVTGFYKPSNSGPDFCAAELREKAFKLRKLSKN